MKTHILCLASKALIDDIVWQYNIDIVTADSLLCVVEVDALDCFRLHSCRSDTALLAGRRDAASSP